MTKPQTYRVLLSDAKGTYAIDPAVFGKAIDWYVIYNTETYELVTVPQRMHEIDALILARRWSANPLVAPDAPIVLDGLLDSLK